MPKNKGYTDMNMKRATGKSKMAPNFQSQSGRFKMKEKKRAGK